MTPDYTPRPEHKFSFGLWTVSNRGRDPFGDVVRPALLPVDAVGMLAEVGAWGVNLHDNDLVPIDASPSERDRIVKEFQKACSRHGIVVPMATVSLFFDPVFRDGAFTSNDAQAWEAGKRFHIDLNDQAPGRYDQDFRFGAANPKSAFFLVKFLEDVGYEGPRHFDAHAYRTEDYDGVKDFARGCMRTYLILKEKAARWNADAEIQTILKEISAATPGTPKVGSYSAKGSAALLSHVFDKDAIMQKRL